MNGVGDRLYKQISMGDVNESGFSSGMRDPVSNSMPILEGQAFQEDLKKRNGGLVLGRPADKEKIAYEIQNILTGAYDDETIQRLAYRNPGIRPAVIQALNQRDRNQRIGQQFFTEGSDVEGATQEFARLGMFNEAGSLRKNLLGGVGSQAKAAYATVADESGEEYRVSFDPFTGAPLGRVPLGTNAFDKDVKTLSKAVKDSQLALVAPRIHRIDKALSSYDESGKLPGVGNLKNMNLSSFLLTPQGKEIKAAISGLNNFELKMLSGAAVTEHEAVRQKIANGLSAANTADDYVRIYRQMVRPAWANIVSDVTASVNPKALSRYMKQNPRAKDIFSLQHINRPSTKPIARPENASQPSGQWSIEKVE